MQWYVYLLTVATTGAFGWFALEFLGRPIRNFFDMRRSVRDQMLLLGNVAAHSLARHASLLSKYDDTT